MGDHDLIEAENLVEEINEFADRLSKDYRDGRKFQRKAKKLLARARSAGSISVEDLHVISNIHEAFKEWFS